jgi:hypothetical protein
MARRPVSPRILVGSDEPFFSRLPATIADNLRRPGSESALLWNLIYPLAQPAISLRRLLHAPVLWGVPTLELEEDQLQPYFWGRGINGRPLPGLDGALQAVDGAGPQTEIDLLLVGQRHLIAVEAKHLADFGICRRYQHERCPEIHADVQDAFRPCRYWEPGAGYFSARLDVGERPVPGTAQPPCWRHYQLARTLLAGSELAGRLDRHLSLWAFVPRRRWPALQSDWLDFVDRLIDADLWRRARVISWEAINALPRR